MLCRANKGLRRQSIRYNSDQISPSPPKKNRNSDTKGLRFLLFYDIIVPEMKKCDAFSHLMCYNEILKNFQIYTESNDMKNRSFHIEIQENGTEVIKDSTDTAFAEISVCKTNCLLTMYRDEDPKIDKAIISCQTDDDTRICKNELVRFILNGDPDKLNWYIGMDYNDVDTFFSGKELRFFHYKEDLSAIDDLAKKINAQFSDNSDLLIYVESTHAGFAFLDRLHFSRWLQFSHNETIATEIKVSIWHNETEKSD